MPDPERVRAWQGLHAAHATIRACSALIATPWMDSHAFDEQPLAHAHTGACGHLVQLYSDQAFLLATLEDFICAGLDTGQAAIVIATAPHLHALEARLQARRIDLVQARNENRYIPFGAADAMDRFMVDGWPDAARFIAFLAPVLARARGRGRKVRGFGEMVAILWARGQREAALELE